MSQHAIPRLYTEGERIVMHDPRFPGKRWHGFVLEDRPPYKLLVSINGNHVRVGRQHVRRDP